MGTNYNVKLKVLTANYKTRSGETLAMSSVSPSDSTPDC